MWIKRMKIVCPLAGSMAGWLSCFPSSLGVFCIVVACVFFSFVRSFCVLLVHRSLDSQNEMNRRDEEVQQQQQQQQKPATNEVFHFDFGFKINYILQMITVSWFPSASGLSAQRDEQHCHLYDSRYSIKSNPFSLDLSISRSLSLRLFSRVLWDSLQINLWYVLFCALSLSVTICQLACLTVRLLVWLCLFMLARIYMYVCACVYECVCTIFKDPAECCYFEHPAAFNWWSKKWHSQQQHHLLCVSMITRCYSVHT